MADLYEQGINFPYDSVNAGVVQPEVYGIAINWYVNRTPVWARLPKPPVGSLSFLLTNDNYRPRAGVVRGAVADGTTTSIGVGDASIFDVGDVLEIDSENLMVTAVNVTANNTDTLTVTRSFAGSTGATHADVSAIYILTNARTGGEVDINAISRKPAAVEQYTQTIQHAYQVSGALESATNYVSGLGGPLQRDKMLCMQHCADDMESGIYYGKGSKFASQGGRQAMKGLRSLIQTNNVTTPTNAGAYKPSDLVRDVIQSSFDGGGAPGLLVVSTDFLTGLSIWGERALRLDVGANAFGTRIEAFEVAFLPGLTIVPAPLLRKGTVIALTTPEVRVRMKRPLVDKPRGSRGDAVEGDMIMEGAVELDNEAHHAYVSGITGYSAN